MPGWCEDATLNGPDGVTSHPGPGYVEVTRRWQTGDRVELDLAMPVRLTRPHPRVDAVRGCLAIERGPLVYAVEQVDLPDGPAVDDLQLPADDPSALETQWRPDLLGGCVVVTGDAVSYAGATCRFTAVPYALWANRGAGPMRVWLPLADGAGKGR